eukprot:COSAG01_NODE_2236_length_8092_cov_2.596772_6_plen_58_part_00
MQFYPPSGICHWLGRLNAQPGTWCVCAWGLERDEGREMEAGGAAAVTVSTVAGAAGQ